MITMGFCSFLLSFFAGFVMFLVFSRLSLLLDDLSCQAKVPCDSNWLHHLPLRQDQGRQGVARAESLVSACGPG